MKTKQVKDYIYEGLGFPVYLEQAQLIYIEKEWHLKIDVRKLATKVIKSLVSQDERLTGNQVKLYELIFLCL